MDEIPDRRDYPEAKAFTGHVTFKCAISDADIEVRASVVEDQIEWDSAEVWYEGVIITPTLVDAQRKTIQEFMDENRWRIFTDSEVAA